MASCSREIRYARHFPGTAAHQTSFTANANQSNECTRCLHGSLRVSQREKMIFITAEIDFYYHRIIFLPPRKLIFTTVKIQSIK